MPQEIACSAVLLATGGMGQHLPQHDQSGRGYRRRDGDRVPRGCGSQRHGVRAVSSHRALHEESAAASCCRRRCGPRARIYATLNWTGFMGKYHPLGELAPHDLVARAIVHEMEVSRAKDPFVYLDLTHLAASKVQKHFPRIYETLHAAQRRHDRRRDSGSSGGALCIGGVRTDLDGKTNVAGLYAAGEIAATGVHGANRLPSNSLLEGIVYGARAGKAMRGELKSAPKPGSAAEGGIFERSRRGRSRRVDRTNSRSDVERSRHRAHAHGNAESGQDSGRDGAKAGESQDATGARGSKSTSRRAGLSRGRPWLARKAAARTIASTIPDHDDKNVSEALGRQGREGRLRIARRKAFPIPCFSPETPSTPQSKSEARWPRLQG